MHTILAGALYLKFQFKRYIYSPIAHLPKYTLFTPKTLHNLSFLFLLGITVVPREMKDNACAKFWGTTRCIIDVKKVNGLLPDVTVNDLLLFPLIYSSISFWLHKRETLVLFTFSVCLLVLFFFQLLLLSGLLCDTFGESISCVNAPFVEQNAVYSTTKITK